MDVETLNVVLDATYAPAVRGLDVADAALGKTAAAARTLETASGQTGRAMQTAGADAASIESQVAGVGKAFREIPAAAAAAAEETGASLTAIGAETQRLNGVVRDSRGRFASAGGGAATSLAATTAATRSLGAASVQAGAASVQAGNAIESSGRKAGRAAGEHAHHAGALKETSREARGAASAVTGMSRAFAFASNAFLAGAGAGFVLKKIYDDTTRLQDAQTQLGNVVDNTGGSWRRQHGAIETYVGGLSDLSKFSPADLTNDLTRLDGVTQSVAKSERDLTLATNIARATHKPLDTVVRALTLAEAGRTTGLSRLGIVLPKITTQQDALRAKLADLKTKGLAVSAAVKTEAMERAKAADGLVSFGTAIGGLTTKYGNADKVFGKTGAGHLADLKKNAEDLATSVGKVLVPEIDKGVISADDWFAQMTKSGKAERDVKEGITVIGDVFHVVDAGARGAADAVGGFGNVLKIVLGLYGVKLAFEFERAIERDIRSAISFGRALYGIGAKAVGVAGRLLGIGASSTEATAAVEGDSMTMQGSIDALTAAIETLITSLGGIPVAAAEAAGGTDASLGVIGGEVDALQLQIEGLDASFTGMPVAAATAAAETDTSLGLVGVAAADATAEVTALDTALTGMGAAAAAGAATAAGVLEGLAALTAGTFAAAAVGAAAVVTSSGAAPDVKGIPKAGSEADIAKLAESGKIPPAVLKAAAKKAGISPDTPAGNALANPVVLQYLTKYAKAHGMVVANSQGLDGPAGKQSGTALLKGPVGHKETPLEQAVDQQKKLQAQAAKQQRQFEAQAKADQAKWEKLIADGAKPIPVKQSMLDKVLPTGRQASLEKAEAAAKNGNVTAEKHLVQVAQEQLDYLNKEHASGHQLVVLERERAKLAGIIAAAHKKITAELAKQTNTAIGRKEEKILGLGPNGAQTSPGQVSLKMREHKILDNEIAKMFGGSKHSIAVAAQNLGVSTATLLHGTNEQLIAEMKKLGITLPATTLDSLNKINLVLKNKFLPPDVRANLQARLTQIEQTLNSGMTALSNMKPVKSTDLVKGLGLDGAQKIALESRIAQEMAHGGKVPTGRAADGIPLASTNTPVGKKPPHSATKAAAGSKAGSPLPKGQAGLRGLHGDSLATATPLHPPTELATSTAAGVTINGLSVDVTIMGGDQKTAKQLAKEIAPAIIDQLAKHQLRRGGGT